MIRLALKQHLVTLCACLGLLVLAGCGSSVQAVKPTATTAATATTVGGGTVASSVPCSGTYSNPHISLSCPAGWTETPFASASVGIVDGVVLKSADGTASFTITPVNQALGADQYVAFLQAFLSSAGGTNININPTATQQALNGNNYTINEVTFDRSGTPQTGAQLVTVHNGFTYFLVTLAPTSDYSSVGNQYFQTILQSLQLK